MLISINEVLTVAIYDVMLIYRLIMILSTKSSKQADRNEFL